MSWEMARFGDLYGEPSRNGISVSKNQHDGSTNIVNMGELFESDYVGDSEMRRIKVDETELHRFCLAEGDLLFARRSLVASGAGKAALVSRIKEPTVFESSIIRVRLNRERACPRFYLYWLKSFAGRDTVSRLVTGTNVKGIRGSELSEVKVPLPSLNEQMRIADILSAYDSLIESCRKQIALLEEAAQRLYKEWFVDLHFPGYETTPIIDGLPEGWRKGKLGDFISFVSGYAFKSSSFSQQGEYKVVTIKNVLDGKFDNNGMSSISDFPENMPGECILHQGDILISLTGNVGRVCQVIGEKYVLNQRVAKIKTEAKAFTYCFLRLRTTKTLLESMSSGTAQKNLSPIKTLQMPIMIPDERLIQLFELRGQPLLAAIVNLESQIKCTREARDRLLPKLMSGEIEVS